MNYPTFESLGIEPEDADFLFIGADAMRLMRHYGWIERRTIRDMAPDERRAYDTRTRNAWGKRRHIKRQA